MLAMGLITADANLGIFVVYFNPLNAKLNPICHLLALLGVHPIFHVSRMGVNLLLFYFKL
jgi:hypothetical protein